MDDILDQRLANLFAHARESDIEQGLLPLAERLSRQFGAGDASAVGKQLPVFCREYILQAPVISRTLIAIGREFRLSALLDTYLALSAQYLESACDEIEIHDMPLNLEQFLILLQGAYIFGRMVEELDDKIEAFIGIPLQPVNLLDANLIVHEIIGDAFANRLDKVVSGLLKQSVISKSVIEANLDRHTVETAKKASCCLNGQRIENFAEKHGLDLAAGFS